MSDPHETDTLQIGDSRYGRPFRTEYGLMVTVYEPDDRYTTYGVAPAVVAAWAEHDRTAPAP